MNGSGSRSVKYDNKPKLLLLSQVLPYPPDGGVKIRTYHTLRLLSQAFEVHALCFYRWKRGKLEQDVDASLRAIGEFAALVEAFPIPQEHSRLRFVWDHLRSATRRLPYTRFVYESAEFEGRVRALFSEHDYSLVHADSLDLSAHFPLVTGAPLITVHHDVQSVLLERRAARETSWARKRYVGMQARLMEREEREWCPRVSLNVTVSEKDRDTLTRITSTENLLVVPNGVDVDAFKPVGAEGDASEIVFVGGTTWFPNLDGMRHFCSEILPLLRERLGDIPVRWVGRASSEEISHYRDVYGVDLTGYVPDVRPYLAAASCVVVPIRVGGGTRIKILDAWAMGRAVVSTTIGCEGLNAVNGENLLICDSPDRFAEGVQRVVEDASLRSRLEQGGRRTVVSEYSWTKIGERMNARYMQLLHK
jgi:polysaccharide biosynthesis protein PslH